ncbi:hypothetical protein BDW59DRAFT_140140 [Aspergillus cavernicola]|uniref:Fungal-specific transcription factor domain-containing protein n=1 Tax=Aspergillus cavernicola TaxID=176166 RepID=A0ABR4IX57_9EURO
MVRDSSIPTGQFQFISIQAPHDAKDQIQRRLARSHAVKHALQNKRRQQQKSRDNFRVTTVEDSPRKVVSRPRFSLSAGALDPFQTLAVDASRLQTLLGDYRARQAAEPVFSIAEELAFQNFHSVFRTGFDDPALLNAVMLSLAFAVTGSSIDQECLRYQGQAISYIRERMSSLGEATSEPTIGAILLLAGVEARLGMTPQVQLHMGAVHQLLRICQTQGIFLTGGIKRAIFWQDLNSSILVGSPRIYNHTTFSELQWTRDPFVPSFFRLPSGFQTRSDLLTKELIEVLEDVHALQCIRDVPYYTKGDVMLMEQINNHTASIQSRLVSLPRFSAVQECCHLAAYLCSVMLCCKVWCALVIPSHVSSRLLRELHLTNNDRIWDKHPGLLLWLLCIGGAFAPTGIVRSEYVGLLRLNNVARFGDLDRSWPQLVEILEGFIWSEKAFLLPAKAFWEEALT